MSSVEKNDFIDTIIRHHPKTVLQFLKLAPKYEDLGKNITVILRTRLNERNVGFAEIRRRTKTLDSFCEKMSRKEYAKPFEEITDISGVRIVYLYKTDKPVIENIVEDEFFVLEKEDKTKELEPDRFGYGGLHYLVTLGDKSQGAHYDSLKQLTCEIQVRTVLQDAWATIAHHLSYKMERAVPTTLQRKLNALAGLLETADEQFWQMWHEKREYQERLRRQWDSIDVFLAQELNIDTLAEFMRWKYPDVKLVDYTDHLSRILPNLIQYNYKTLRDLNNLLGVTNKARKEISEIIPEIFPVNFVARALGLAEPGYRKERWRSDLRSLLEKHALSVQEKGKVKVELARSAS